MARLVQAAARGGQGVLVPALGEMAEEDPHDMIDTVAMHHHRMHRHHTTRHHRRMRRMNTMRHGNPNAKNPALRGYQQNLGGTTNGPRY